MSWHVGFKCGAEKSEIYVFGSRMISIIWKILRGQPANSFLIMCQETTWITVIQG